jgi:hypothetical protein
MAQGYRFVGWVAVLCGACVMSPLNGDNVADTSAPISFWGYGQSPSVPVSVEAAASASGPFSAVPIPSTKTSAQVSWTLAGGFPLYGFSASAAIPAAAWHGVSGCSTKETFLRVHADTSALMTFDTAGGLFCFQNQLNNGADYNKAIGVCRAARSPLARITQGAVVHVGDVLIDDASDIAPLACVDTIQGSLTVTSTAPNNVSLPNLHRVTGNVQLTYTSYLNPQHPGGYQINRCGALRSVTADVRTFDLPVLEAVQGSLTLVQEGSFSGSGVSTQPIELGLNSLGNVGGDVSITIAQFGGSPCGLTGLAYVPGNLTLNWMTAGEIDGSVNTLLSGVTEVAGTFTMLGGHNRIGTPLASMVRAGALHFEGNGYLSGFTFPKLTTVTGNAYLAGMTPNTILKTLTSVGSLELVSSALSSLEQVGGTTLGLAGLSLQNNSSLSALLNNQAKSKVTLTPQASVSLSGNGSLPHTQVCKFASFEKTLGWTGPLTGDSCP